MYTYTVVVVVVVVTVVVVKGGGRIISFQKFTIFHNAGAAAVHITGYK